MRKIFVAAALTLVAFSSAVSAEGTIVRWDRVEGVLGDQDTVSVGPILYSGRWRTTGEGRVQLNLKTGFLSVRVSGVSCGQNYPNCPLGSPTGAGGIATVVCNATERFGPITWVNTPPLVNSIGGVTYEGFLDLPAACREHPEELVFLLRHREDQAPFFGSFMLYGAERSIH
jgi:hypothetical protein